MFLALLLATIPSASQPATTDPASQPAMIEPASQLAPASQPAAPAVTFEYVRAFLAKLPFAVYGQVRVDAIYDSRQMNNIQSPIFVARQVAGIDPGSELSLHPRLSRIGIRTNRLELAPEVALDARIEIDFQNGGRESREIPRIRHAYAELAWRGFRLLLGQTWQTVSRLIPLANGDTLMWGVGNTGDRSPQVRLSYALPFGEGRGEVRIEAAAQAMGTVDNLGQAGLNFGAVPAVQGRLALRCPMWGEQAWHIAFSAHYGAQKLTEKLVGRTRFDQVGYFGEVDMALYQRNGVRGEVFFGSNLSDLRGGIGQGVNPVRDLSVRTMGLWGEVYSNPAAWMELAAGVGIDDPLDADLEFGLAHYNRAIWGVVHFRPLPDTRIGLEYVYWSTGFQGETTWTSHRVNAHFTWSFDSAP